MRVLILALALFMSTSVAFAAGSIGKVLAVKGDVHAVQMDGTIRAKLKLSSFVYANEKILTGAGSKVQVVFNDKSLITIGENAEVILDKYTYDPKTDEGTSIIEVTKGIFKFLTGKIAKKNYDKVKVNTPFATIGVRGSGGIIHVGETGQTTLNMTQCCLNISARGSNQTPVNLVKVNTFSRVSANGEVTQPKPAPLSMLMQMNKAISLKDAEVAPQPEKAEKVKAEPSQKEAKKERKSSLKSLVRQKKEENRKAEPLTTKSEKTAQVPQNKREVQVKNETGVYATPSLQTKKVNRQGRSAPYKGSLVSLFGSEKGGQRTEGSSNTFESTAPLTDIGASLGVNASEAKQQEQAQTTLGSNGTNVAILGKTLGGQWQRKNAGIVKETGNMQAVINEKNNIVIFKNIDSTGQTKQTVAFSLPSQGTAKVSNTPEFGEAFIYRGVNDNFVYGANVLKPVQNGNRYTFITGNKGFMTQSSQQIAAGQRLFFNFIPDADKTTQQFANFNLATGVPNPLLGTNFAGRRANQGAGLVVDYSNDNTQFLGGYVGFSHSTGTYKNGFKFMAGDMLNNTGNVAMDGTAYSFVNGVGKSGNVTANIANTYGANNTQGSPVIDAYNVNLGGGFNDNIYAVNSQVTAPTAGNGLITSGTPQTLKGYSAGYLTNNAGVSTMVANKNAADITMVRKDYTSGGVKLESTFKYSKVTSGLASTSTADKLQLTLGGDYFDTANKAYIDHNIYGAASSDINADFSMGASFDTDSTLNAADVQAAMLSSYFVDVPNNIAESCQDCQYLTWGVWAGDIAVTGDNLKAQIIPYVVGDVNQMKSFSTLSNVGSNVNYKGVLVGAISGNSAVKNAIGSYDANVNFGNRSMTFNGDFAQYKFDGTIGAGQTSTSLGSLGATGFTELTLDNLYEKGNSTDVGQATISGAFYGNNAENMGGNFNLNDTTKSITGAGIFAGKKQP